ncbi:MAG: hypothetical protein ACR2IM_10560 [Sediminibacterium sp.]
MKNYNNIITLNKNDRGIWDLDVSKGCSSGCMIDKNGCYGDCYAAKSAKIYGYDFSKTIYRDFINIKHQRQIISKINSIDMSFIRIGVAGDPSENWEHTFSILRKIKKCNKEIVIITKHWNTISDELLIELNSFNICINTSISALDNEAQRNKCLFEYKRLKTFCKSILRIVSCDFNADNEIGKRLLLIQEQLFKNENVIDTVFRVSKNNNLVIDGVINIKKVKFLGGKSLVSKYNKKTYFGKCDKCVEQCGVFKDVIRRIPQYEQAKLFNK